MKTFENVASLKLAKLKAGQFVETGGYYEKGGTGAARYFIKTSAQATLDGDVYSATSTINILIGNGNVAVLQISNGQLPLSVAGGIPDFDGVSGTDNQPIVDAAEVYCLQYGYSVLYDGKFGVGTETVAQPIAHLGIMRGTSGLYALNDGHRIFTWSSSITEGGASFKSMTLHGYADRNPTQGGDANRVIEVSPIDEVIFDDVEVAYSRQISIASRATRSTVKNCHIHHSHRDGINLADSQYRFVDNNLIEFCADDAIACHSNESNYYTESVITNNIIYNSFGIKCLSSKFTISGNRGEFIFGYGIQYGKGSGFAEGDISTAASSITDNTFINIINTISVGGGDLGACLVSSPAYAKNAEGLYPLDYDSINKVIVDPLDGLEEYSTAKGAAGTFGVVIAKNNFLQTWTGGATVSDYGRGEQAWTINGFEDITLTGTLGKDGNSVQGYRFVGVVSDVVCDMGATYGFTTGLIFQSVVAINNSRFDLGVMTRIYDKAVTIGKATGVPTLHCKNSSVYAGVVDMDPLHEHPERELVSGEPTGGWTNTGGDKAVVLEATGVAGFVFEGVTVSNAQKIASLSGGGAIVPIVRNLNVFTGDGIGVGVVNSAHDQNRVYIDADPRSATYKEVIQGNLLSRNTVPTSGYYFSGQKINNSDYTGTAGGSKYSNLVRLTTGNSHVFGTDWDIVKLGA